MRTTRTLLLAFLVALGRPAPLTMHHIDTCSQCGRAPQGQPGSWCTAPPSCTPFSYDAAHRQGPSLAAAGCAALACNATIYCLAGTFDLFAATDPAVPPCPPAPAPTPAPPPHEPVWHLPARCEEGDVNALFQFNGTWHLFQQWHARPQTSVGHAVSEDLLHWRRLPDALASGAGGDQQCYDGSSSLVTVGGPGSGTLTPMLMIDGGCGEKGPGSHGCMESSGNGSTGGVTAFPADLADPDLREWRRSAGPTVFQGCDGSAGPSPILVNPVTGARQLIAIHGGGEALFEALDDTLTAWRMADPLFLPSRGGGGGLWHTLPLPVDDQGSSSSSSSSSSSGGGGAGAAEPWATHIMQLDGANGDGGATFALMRVDPASSKVTRLAPTAALDLGVGPRFGQLSNSGGTARGGAAGDARTVHVSWNAFAHNPVPHNPVPPPGPMKCNVDPAGTTYKWGAGNLFPDKADHGGSYGPTLVDPSQCCALCQSFKNCSFWTYSAGGTKEKPVCYGLPGGCCFLNTAAAAAGKAMSCPTCTAGSSNSTQDAASVWEPVSAASACTAANVDVGQLTSFRDLRFDARLNAPHGALVENPIAEYLALRAGVLDRATAVPLASDAAPTKVLALGAGPTAADIEMNITALAPGVLTLALACGGSGPSDACGLSLTLAVGAALAGGARNVTMSAAGRSTTFALLAGEGDALPLRVMTDTGSVEVFAGFGRAVYSGGLAYGACAATPCLVTAAFAAAAETGGAAAKVASAVTATAWQMMPIAR